MNVRSGRKNTTSHTSSAARKDPKFTTQLCRLMLILFLMGTVASVLCVHIYMNQQIAETGREIKKIKQEAIKRQGGDDALLAILRKKQEE